MTPHPFFLPAKEGGNDVDSHLLFDMLQCEPASAADMFV